MIKTLQRKFITSAMIAIALLLTALLGGINIVNAWSAVKQCEKLVDIFLYNELNPMPQLPGRRMMGGGFFEPPITEDTRLATIFFSVRTDGDGRIHKVNLSRIASVTEEEAREIAGKVTVTGKMSGFAGQFLYKAGDSDTGKIYVFLDASEQIYSVSQIAMLSVLAGAAAWVIMLLPVWLLSKKAIAPIAQNIERQKQFITDAGHELKTPVSVILANVEVCELQSGESKWTKNIKDQAERMSGLVKNLLTIAKTDEMHFATKEGFSLSDLVCEVFGMFYEGMEIKGISLEKDILQGVEIFANKEQISELVSILADNAVKYSPNGGKIFLSVSQKGKTAELTIENYMEKIPECPPEKLFERFYRVDAARTQKSGGCGIGLSAAEVLAEANGGKISARYTDKGTIIFSCTI